MASTVLLFQETFYFEVSQMKKFKKLLDQSLADFQIPVKCITVLRKNNNHYIIILKRVVFWIKSAFKMHNSIR